jgi:hypothetical protein
MKSILSLLILWLEVIPAPKTVLIILMVLLTATEIYLSWQRGNKLILLDSTNNLVNTYPYKPICLKVYQYVKNI